MRNMRLKVFSNRISADIGPVISFAQSYNSRHLVSLTIDVQAVSVSGYKSANVEVRPNDWQWILQGAENCVAVDPSYDIAMFMFDQNEWKAPAGSKYPLRGDCPSSDCILVNGKPFINLGIYSPDLSGMEITFIHELMHAYKYVALAEGFVVNDVMDVMFVNGVPEPYFLNDQPDNVNGNFISMWEQFFHSGFMRSQ